MEVDKIQQMRDKLLLCSVCMEEFDDPRILPCHHSFCLGCIDDIVNSSFPVRRFFSCPQCRYEVRIPKEGIQKFPVNFYLIGLQEELGEAEFGGWCHICEVTQVQFHCMSCDVNICKFCISSHRLLVHLSGSDIIRLSSPCPSTNLTSLSCEKHDDEMLQLFCHTCEQAVCIICSCSQHKHHNLVPLTEQLQESKLSMEKGLDKLLIEFQQASEAKDLIDACKKQLVNTSNESLLNLDHIATKSCKTIMNIKSKIEREIKTSTAIQMVHVNRINEKLLVYTNFLKKGQDFLIDFKDSDICMEAFDSYKKYMANVKEIRDCYTSSKSLIQQKCFIPSSAIRTFNINLGHQRQTQLLYGNLGFLGTKPQNITVDTKSLKVILKPKKILGFTFFSALMKINIFIISFVFFNYVFSDFDKKEFSHKMPITSTDNICKEIGNLGPLAIDVGRKVLEEFFFIP